MSGQSIAGRAGAWLLLLAALLVRAAVPQGYMVEADERAGLTVTICGADGTWTIPLADDLPGQHGQQEEAAAGAACHFAGHAGKAAPVGETPGALLLVPVIASYAVQHEYAIGPPPPRPLPPARAPPLPA